MVALTTARITPIRTREAQVGMFEWIGELTGQVKVPVFTCPDVFVAMCDGDSLCAIFLAQVHFLQQQTPDPDGWVVESGKYWAKRFGISPYQLRCFAKSLIPFGLKAEKRGVHPSITWHFQIDEEKLRKATKEHIQSGTTMKNFTVSENTAPSNDEKIARQSAKISPLTMKNSIVDDEKFHGSIEKEDLEINEEDQEPSDANASGDAADADAPMPAPSAPVWDDETETAGEAKDNTPLQGRSSKGRSSAAPAEGRARASPPGKGKGMTRTDKDPDGESSFRRMCFRLMGERYERFNRERLAGTARRLFNQGYTEEQVEGCWRETIRDPRYSPLNPLTFDILAQGATNKIDGFIQDPDEYRRKIQDEIEKHEYIEGRKKANGKSGKRDRSPATEHHASTRADVF